MFNIFQLEYEYICAKIHRQMYKIWSYLLIRSISIELFRRLSLYINFLFTLFTAAMCITINIYMYRKYKIKGLLKYFLILQFSLYSRLAFFSISVIIITEWTMTTWLYINISMYVVYLYETRKIKAESLYYSHYFLWGWRQ